MRFYTFALLLSFFLSAPSFAQTEPNNAVEPQSGAAQTAKPHDIQIVTDTDAGAIRFVIDGQEVARFSVNGLRVRNNMLVGGVITDTGPASYDDEDDLKAAGTDAP